MTHVESTDLDPLMQGEPPEAEAPLSPQARLDASRAALQQWMIRTYHPERLAPDPDTPTHGSVRPDNANPDDPPWLSALVDSLSDVPIGAVAARYLRRWWRRHPLRATAELGNELGRELLAPAAAKHPWLVLGGAVAAGVLLSRLKPWRWLSGTAILSSLVPPISLASLLASVTAMFQSAPAEPASAPRDGAETAETAQVSEPV
jgi:hypothetical protein